MRRLLTILSAALICAVAPASAQTRGISMSNTHKSPIGVIGKKSSALVLGDTKTNTKTHAFDKMMPGRQPRMATPQSSLTARGFGFLDGPDGTTWTFKQDNVDGEEYAYSSSVVTVYDADNTEKGSFTVETPETMRVNMIEPYGLVTNKLFDKNASTYEVVVYLHEVGNADNGYKGTDHLWVYNLNGEKVADFLGDGMVVDASPNEWTLYQRLVVAVNDTESNNVNINIYKNPGWNDDSAVLEHTFTLDRNLTEYTDGPFFSFANLNGSPYYVLAHYDKSYVEYDEEGHQILDDETGLPYFTEDKHFIIEAYNKNYEQAANISVPCETPSEDYFTRLVSFGTFSEHDITRGFFTNDDRLNFIVMNEDANMLFEYNTSFDVYDQDGNKVMTIAESVGDYYDKMADIKGFEEQWIFLNGEGTGLFTVDLPSCTRHEMPAMIDNDTYSISTNIDRVPYKNAEGYQYIMAINEAKTDATGINVIASFAHLNPDFSLDHYVDINLGPLAQTFSPLVNYQGLDPYLFNTDSQREFLFFSKLRDSEDPEQVGGHNTLFVANEKGDIVETFNLEPGNEKGDIWTASILNYGTQKQSLFINYYNWDEDINTMEYYSLPLVKFQAGGDGTPENPYLISSIGDIKLIAKEPGANYKLACDINGYGHTVAVEEFSGVFDGDNHQISFLDTSSDNYYAGLFGNATGATIKNLRLAEPRIDGMPHNEQLGLLCGYAIESTFSNIFVANANINATGSAATPVGGLVGMLSASSEISDCYLFHNYVKGHSTVGGVAGEMRTSSVIKNCAVAETEVEGHNYVGGYAGIIGNGCEVKDGSADWVSVRGNTFLGCVAGSCGISGTRGAIRRCIVNGEIQAQTTNHIGGIAGAMEPLWQKGEEDKGAIEGCVNYDINIINISGSTEGTMHRIVGSIITDEDPSREETKLSNNYVYVDEELTAGAYTAEGGTANSVEGADIDIEKLLSKDFYTGLGYAFGEDTTAPWVEPTMISIPRLYFEDEGNIPSRIEHATAPAFTVKAQGIYNLSGQRVSNATKGIYIINGKKIIK